MDSRELLRISLQMSGDLLLPLLQDMQDAPMTPPTPNGGNHPTWIAGHMAFAEGNLFLHTMRGEPNPLDEWKSILDGGTQPSDDPSIYPSMDESISRFQELREQTMALLGSLSEEDLDQPSVNCPEERKAFFGTWRQCFLAAVLHGMMHRGQVADCRRALGREPLMG